MDNRRSAHALNDTLEREIERALAVDPSPEFLARARTRIASEPEPSSWRFGWMVTAAAAAAVLTAVLIVQRMDRTPASVATAPLAATLPAPLSNPVPAERPQDARGSTGSPRASLADPGGTVSAKTLARPELVEGRSEVPPAASEPEILIDAREASALRALVAGVRDGRVDLALLLRQAPSPPMELPPIADIVIAPIIIEPLAPPAGAEGVRQ